MAKDRISRETAEQVPLPPHTWYVRSIEWLLEQPKVKENIKSVPLNKPLMKSLREHGMKSPILTMPNWYPIAGSQRLRALHEIVKSPAATDRDWAIGQQEVRVCRINKEYWLMYYLWGDKEFRDKAVAIYFQMVELVWKSRYYEDEFDPSGVKMTDFEELGDKLEWKHKSNLGIERIKSQQKKNNT
tara:strand:- start:1017 stop:1574 length:558 start_codon:yes stop_codon:yes gene_type:complete